MKALVTGATGFVGSNLVEELLEAGVDVVCLVRPTSDIVWIRHLPVDIQIGALEDSEVLARAVEDVDYIFHVAGLTRARTEQEYRRVNTDGTRRLVDAAVGACTRLRRFIYVSSLAAVGPNRRSRPVDESTTPHPIDGYGASKLAAEYAVLNEADRLPVTILRPPAIFGPRDRNFLPIFRSAQRFGRVPVVGSLEKQVSFIHIADLTAGIWLTALEPVAIGKTYFMAGGTHTLGKVVETVGKSIGRPVRPLRIAAPLARFAGELGEWAWRLTGKPRALSRHKVRHLLQKRWTCSWAKAHEEMNFRPTVRLISGMKQTAWWYGMHGWLRPVPDTGDWDE
ncbi:MAG: NAD-dependent epimerase/dehydratase family protein [Kiritimatiellae bacterium]|nr:NAD-dependent epimerase/dehydratase family protein [Kiritimatiellia bacterium]